MSGIFCIIVTLITNMRNKQTTIEYSNLYFMDKTNLSMFSLEILNMWIHVSL